MKYISHIKELVSGIIENKIVTRDTEAYDALTALYNHLDTLEEVQKYMPYKDPGPVIEKLEQSLTKANTRNQELRKQALYLNEEIEQKTKSRDQCYQYWQEYKSKYETLEQKNHQDNKELEQFQSQIEKLKSDKEDLIKEAESLDKLIRSQDTKIEDLNKELEQKNTHIYELLAERKDLEKNVTTLENQIQDQTQTLEQKQEEINFLVGILSEEQLGEHQEYLRTQLPDDQPQYSNTQQHYRSKKRR